MNDLNIDSDDLFERIELLEKCVRRLNNIIQFHKLHEIDRKYLKAYPKDNESPFFTIKKEGDKPVVYELGYSIEDGSKLWQVQSKDPKEYEEAKLRMQEYAEKAKKNDNKSPENPLLKHLEQEFIDNDMICFEDKWPIPEDFPIWVYSIEFDSNERIEEFYELDISPSNCFNYKWCKIFIGD